MGRHGVLLVLASVAVTQVLGQTRTVPKPAGCGTTIGCYSDCQQSTCSFVVSWSASQTIATYTLTANVYQTTGSWIAVAFSTDQTMKDDNVLGCARNAAGQFASFNARTGDHSLPPTAMYNDAEVNLTSSVLNNSILTCTIQRPVSGSTAGRADVAIPWTLFFATGPATVSAANQVSIEPHTQKYFSPEQVKVSELKNIGEPSQPAAEPALAGTVPKPAGCGSTFGCFSNCQGSTCGFVVSWRVVGDTGEYTLVANVASSAVTWIAVAFSSDNVMKDDDVLGCATNGSRPFVPFRARTGDHNIAEIYSNDNVGVISSNLSNNVMTCIIQRPISGNSAFGRFDVTSPWTLLFATASGSLVGDKLQLGYHKNNKYVSNQKISINDKVDALTGALEYPLVKAHGSLMITAWIFLASIGIVLARYFKPAWNGLICSEKVWFQMHRICMILVFLLTSIGFIIIFIEVDGYSKIQDNSRTYLVGHPIIGIIVMILTVLNPIMALFRCHPGTSMRPIFNWSHRIVGTSAHFLGVLNIFFGVLLSKSNVSYCPIVYILGAYVAWQIFVELLLEVITCFGLKKERNEAYELSSGDNQKHTSTEESRGTIVIKRIILVAHCFIVAAFAAVLIGLLATGK